jgi:hypothetical protein
LITSEWYERNKSYYIHWLGIRRAWSKAFQTSLNTAIPYIPLDVTCLARQVMRHIFRCGVKWVGRRESWER